ncbi:MAG: phosphonate ABC transporter, permease protein PhnE [Acidobacteriota bacterium]
MSASPAAAPGIAPVPPRQRRWWLRGAIVGVVTAMTVWAVVGIGFDLGVLMRNLAAANRLIDDSFPPEWSFLPQLWGPFIETVQIAIIGTIVGGLVAVPVAILAARPIAPKRWINFIDRNFMNVLRTMPDLFWAMLFASAVGFGPLAGALALSVFTVAVVSKLFSESIESIDLGLLEAVRSTGGNWFETVKLSVLPQVLAHYVSYVLYAFELNIRSSMVLGLVGAGGIGMVLEEQRTTFQYQRVTLIILAIFVVVLLIERTAELARRRLV